jgi:hypothetical protein
VVTQTRVAANDTNGGNAGDLQCLNVEETMVDAAAYVLELAVTAELSATLSQQKAKSLRATNDHDAATMVLDAMKSGAIA